MRRSATDERFPIEMQRRSALREAFPHVAMRRSATDERFPIEMQRPSVWRKGFLNMGRRPSVARPRSIAMGNR
jgi:hypothetical protein